MRLPSSSNSPAQPLPESLTGPAAHVLRLHAALTQHDLWHALRLLARDLFGCTSLSLELDRTAAGASARTYRHGHPAAPREARGTSDPTRDWLERNVGRRSFRLSAVVPPRELQQSAYFHRVMRRQGWDKQLAIVAWRGRFPHGRLNLLRAPSEPDFSPRELRLADVIQPHFETALQRVLAHEDAVYLGEQLAKLLDDAPVGLLVLDWELRPLWFNREGAHACAVWNHGERRGAALHAKRAFRVPPPVASACAELRAQWNAAAVEAREIGFKPRVLSDDALGLHAQVALYTPGANPLLRPGFQVQLDYRRPRGDRNRPLSPGAVALLARLSAREREVAMRVREGLSTREIADELHRSPLTIKTQLASIFSKLGLGSRSRVAALLNR